MNKADADLIVGMLMDADEALQMSRSHIDSCIQHALGANEIQELSDIYDTIVNVFLDIRKTGIFERAREVLYADNTTK